MIFTPSSSSSDVRGSVLVLVAVGMFPILGMLRSRSTSRTGSIQPELADRADAAALAGGVAYGGICFATPGDTTNGAQSEIGKWAQYYSGAFKNEPAAISHRTPRCWAPARLRTSGRADYLNPTNLQAGDRRQLLRALQCARLCGQGWHELLHGRLLQRRPDEGRHRPRSRHACCDGRRQGVQVSVPNFIKIFNVQPTLHAHARVELRNVQSSADTCPIAVPRSGADPLRGGPRLRQRHEQGS